MQQPKASQDSLQGLRLCVCESDTSNYKRVAVASCQDSLQGLQLCVCERDTINYKRVAVASWNSLKGLQQAGRQIEPRAA